MKKNHHRLGALFGATLLASTALASIAACGVNLDALTGLTQALGAEDAAAGDEASTDTGSGDGTGADATGDATSDAPPDCDRDRRDHGIAPPDGFDGVELAACAPPVDDGVALGRPPHHRGHLAPIYDEDESHSLEDAELQELTDDVTAGCTARNAQLLVDFDTDQSGALSQTEWDAARQALRDAHAAERAAIDTDADGEISDAEHEAARAALIATWDEDDSGDLDETERAAMRADLQQLVRTGQPLPPLPLLGPPGGPGGPHGGHHGGHGHHDDGPDFDGDGPPPPASDTTGDTTDADGDIGA